VKGVTRMWAVTFFIYDLTKEQEQLLKGYFSPTVV